MTATPTPCALAARSGTNTPRISIAMILVAVVLLSGCLVGLSDGAHTAPATPIFYRGLPTASDSGSQLLSAARASLRSGAGPVAAGSSGGGPSAGTSAGGRGGPSATTSPSWSYLNPLTPPRRELPQLVYDAADGYVLLFSGDGPKVPFPADTWKFNGNAWIPLDPTTRPAGRVAAAIAYDPVDRYVVMFGGYNSTTGPLGDTWKFVKGEWTKLSPTTHPGVLVGASMSFDVHDGYAVLFGGSATNATRSNQTWSFVGGDWTLRSPTSSPAGRNLAMMSYDAKDGYVLLFGGNGTGNVPLNDTWKFVGGAWTRLTPATAPSARAAGAMAYSPQSSEIILFGGTANFVTGLSDSWTFSGGSWTKISTLLHPSARFGVAAADGATKEAVLLYGGIGAPSHSDLNDSWKFQGTTWTRVVPALPVSRVAYSLAYDESDGYVLLFGGSAEFSGPVHDLNDTWKFDHGVWSAVRTSVTPSAREFASMTYDQADGYVLLFGGYTPTGPVADTWSFHAGAWSRVSSASGPSARYGAFMTYDASDGYVLLFGGAGPSNYAADTWTYLGGVWSPLNLTGQPSPPPSGFGGMTYDSEDGYVLLYSGAQIGGRTYPDTWNFSNGHWTNLTHLMAHSPTGLYGPAMADDTYDGYPVLQGGAAPSTFEQNGTWEFTPTGWIALDPAQNPGPTTYASMAFDPATNAVVELTPDLPPGTWSY